MAWATIGIKTIMGGLWPTVRTVHRYRGRSVQVSPETKQLAPSLSIETDSFESLHAALKFLQQFVSAVAYVHDAPLPVIMRLGGSTPGGAARAIGEPPFNPPPERDSFLFVPETEDRKALLALALFREGLNQQGYPLRFLSFFKVINVIAKLGAEQINWINSRLDHVRDRERVDKLQQKVINVGQYLYEEGRCAVAHAYAEPLVDPDDPNDTIRLGGDCPLIHDLARQAIQEDLKVPRCPHWQETRRT